MSSCLLRTGVVYICQEEPCRSKDPNPTDRVYDTRTIELGKVVKNIIGANYVTTAIKAKAYGTLCTHRVPTLPDRLIWDISADCGKVYETPCALQASLLIHLQGWPRKKRIYFLCFICEHFLKYLLKHAHLNITLIH